MRRGATDVKSAIYWLNVPLAERTENGGQPVLKYDAPNTLVLPVDGTAYVGIADEEAAERLLSHPDVTTLGKAERSRIEPVPGVPVTWESLEAQIPSLGTIHGGKKAVGLGDVISALTRRVRMHECGSCRRRKRGLNRITVWGWWRDRQPSLQPEG